MSVLRGVNEKIAISTFANGLRNAELRTIIKSRNYQTLNDAIVGAKEEICSNNVSSSSVYHIKNKQNYNRGYYQGNRGRPRPVRKFNHGYNNNFNRSNFHQSRQNYNKNNTNNYRGNMTHNRG